MPKRDGSRCASGTEWVFHDARGAGPRRVFVYQRTEKPTLDIDDVESAEAKEKIRQYNAVRAFVKGLQADDGSLLGAVNRYAAPSDFEALFEKQMEAEIRLRLDRETER